MKDDFYIGYEPQMPQALATRIRGVAVSLIVLAVAVALGVVTAQARFGGGVFEFGRARVFEGRIVEHPYPRLNMDGAAGGYWLVGPGKHGAARLVSGMNGRVVQITGTLIERDGDRMVQVDPGGVVTQPGTADRPQATLRDMGTVVLRGEIVDSKCHLGVMKPGEGPVHRDCAMRCLLGGVPPMLIVHAPGPIRRLPLVAPDGGASTVDLEPWVARPVRVRGVLYARDGEEYLGVARDGITLVP